MSDISWSSRKSVSKNSFFWTWMPLAALLLIWQVAMGAAPSFWVARPSDIAIRLMQLGASGELLRHSAYTLSHALVGLLVSFAVGAPIGICLASYDWLARASKSILLGLYSLPRIALAPLFILWFGIGEASKIAMTASMVVFLVILNVYQGLLGVEPELVDMLRTMRASRIYVFRHVRVPTLVPWILNSLRLGLGLALVGSVISELLGSNRGLGWYIEYSAARFDIVGVFAGLAVLMFTGMILNSVVDFFESRLWIAPKARS